MVKAALTGVKNARRSHALFEIGPLSCAVGKVDKLLTAGERSALVLGEMGGWGLLFCLGRHPPS